MNTVNYVEVNIHASGFGCVNTNGNVNPNTGKAESEDGFKNKVYPKKRGNQLYVSKNCIRSHFFLNEARGFLLSGKVGFNNQKGDDGVLTISSKEMPEVSQTIASSYLGLLRGYMLTEKGGESIKRKSPLTITDFVNIADSQPNLNEVMVNHLALTEDGTKDKNSLFYAETWGDTQYFAKSIINIENLQFISIDSRLGHREVDFGINPKKENLDSEIEAFKQRLVENITEIAKRRGWDSTGVEIEYGLFLRKDALFAFPEEGFLLKQKALNILVKETIERLKSFHIVKSSGFLKVDSLDIGYSHQLDRTLDDVKLDKLLFTEFYHKYDEL